MAFYTHSANERIKREETKQQEMVYATERARHHEQEFFHVFNFQFSNSQFPVKDLGKLKDTRYFLGKHPIGNQEQLNIKRPRSITKNFHAIFICFISRLFYYIPNVNSTLIEPTDTYLTKTPRKIGRDIGTIFQ